MNTVARSRRTVATSATVTLLLVLAGLVAGLGTASAQDPVVPLATDCTQSALPAHTGFQVAPACVKTSMGEVTPQAQNPQLLIVGAPLVVRVGQPITLKVSTRNLVRDRFLAAGAGGYYLESATRNDAGLTRGHFHTECRMLASTRSAPQPDRAGDGLFIATEDGGGGAAPDTVTVTLPGGLPRSGVAQCAAWAGDGSHRTPMMQFANQVPAFDARRVLVIEKNDRRGDVSGNEDPANNVGAQLNDGG